MNLIKIYRFFILFSYVKGILCDKHGGNLGLEKLKINLNINIWYWKIGRRFRKGGYMYTYG